MMTCAAEAAGSGRDQRRSIRDGAGLPERPPAEQHTADDLVAREEAEAAGVGRSVAIVSEQEEAAWRYAQRLRRRQTHVEAPLVAAKVLPVPAVAGVGLLEPLPWTAATGLDQDDRVRPSAINLDCVSRDAYDALDEGTTARLCGYNDVAAPWSGVADAHLVDHQRVAVLERGGHADAVHASREEGYAKGKDRGHDGSHQECVAKTPDQVFFGRIGVQAKPRAPPIVPSSRPMKKPP